MVEASNRQRQRIWRDILILVIVIAIILGIFYYLGVFDKSKYSPHSLTYKVSGSSSVAVITYTKEDGSTTESKELSIPWQLTIKAKKSLVVVLTAGNPTQAGTIKCALFLDGKEWKSDTTNAPGDKVSCAGIVP
jgi:hypothetical protein